MALSLEFADGQYEFHLGLAQINEIQNKCGAGIGAVYARLLNGMYAFEEGLVGNPLQASFKVEDIVETIRQGLIGGGKAMVDGAEVNVSAMRANQLVENYVTAPGIKLEDAWKIAVSVMKARMSGFQPPKPLKKKGRRTTPKDVSTTERPSPTVQ